MTREGEVLGPVPAEHEGKQHACNTVIKLTDIEHHQSLGDPIHVEKPKDKTNIKGREKSFADLLSGLLAKPWSWSNRDNEKPRPAAAEA